METTAAPIRVYVRCRDCLSVAAVEIPRPPTEEPRKPLSHDAPRYQWEAYQQARSRVAFALDRAAAAFKGTCGLCDGKIEVMGRVKCTGTIVTSSAAIPACDGKCTGAAGPNCDCPCGGANHGTGATVRVETVAGEPRVMMRDAAKARARAAEWKTERARVMATRPARLAQLHASGAWISNADYQIAEHFRAVWGRARDARSHAGRMRHTARITEQGIRNEWEAAPEPAPCA